MSEVKEVDLDNNFNPKPTNETICTNVSDTIIHSNENSNNENNVNMKSPNIYVKNYPSVSISNSSESSSKNRTKKSNRITKSTLSKSKSKNHKNNSSISFKSSKSKKKSKSINKNKSKDKNLSLDNDTFENTNNEINETSNKTLTEREQLINDNQNYLKYPITNMYKNFRQANLDDKNLIEISKEEGSFAVGVCNPGGLRSKHITIENFAHRNNLDAVFVSETHLSGKTKPFIGKNYKSYFKNRSYSSSCKGGVSIFIKNEYVQDTVQVESGDGNDEEFVMIKVNHFRPPLILCCVYGPQQTVKKAKMINFWIKLRSLWNKYNEAGYSIIVGGDFNSAIGNQGGLVNNHPSINRSGQLLLEAVNDLEWDILNKLETGDQRTHVDRSAPGSSRALDYLVSNRIKDSLGNHFFTCR